MEKEKVLAEIEQLLNEFKERINNRLANANAEATFNNAEFTVKIKEKLGDNNTHEVLYNSRTLSAKCTTNAQGQIVCT